MATNGSVPAQFYLGVMYVDGRGVPQYDKEAVRILKGCEQATNGITGHPSYGKPIRFEVP